MIKKNSDGSYDVNGKLLTEQEIGEIFDFKQREYYKEDLINALNEHFDESESYDIEWEEFDDFESMIDNIFDDMEMDRNLEGVIDNTIDKYEDDLSIFLDELGIDRE